MNQARRHRFQRILELYQRELDRARASLVDADAAERRALCARDDAVVQHQSACESTARRLSMGANAPDFSHAAQWCAQLLRRCERAESIHSEATRRSHLARQDLQRAYRNVETIEALLRGIAKEEAVELGRQLRREEDGFVLLRARKAKRAG